MERRTFLGTTAASLAGIALTGALPRIAGAASVSAQNTDVLSQKYPFWLPPLGYANTAVEPAVDGTTMTIHHDRHHAAYVTNLNKALETQSALHGTTLRELLTRLPSLPENIRGAVRNNGGGHANHALFWTLLAPATTKAPAGPLAAAITRDFGSQTALVAALKAAGLAQFGSGWAWLVRDGGGKLTVRSTPNQDTPLSDGHTPVIGVDVWEHAYYLKYQNRRADYLDAVLASLNWTAAGAAYGR